MNAVPLTRDQKLDFRFERRIAISPDKFGAPNGPRLLPSNPSDFGLSLLTFLTLMTRCLHADSLESKNRGLWAVNVDIVLTNLIDVVNTSSYEYSKIVRHLGKE